MSEQRDDDTAPAKPHPDAPEKTEITEDGGLYNRSQYMFWHPAENTIRVDGEFTAQQLIWIAEHMKENAKR